MLQILQQISCNKLAQLFRKSQLTYPARSIVNLHVYYFMSKIGENSNKINDIEGAYQFKLTKEKQTTNKSSNDSKQESNFNTFSASSDENDVISSEDIFEIDTSDDFTVIDFSDWSDQ